jgi:uncharacterized membrane protein YccC
MSRNALRHIAEPDYRYRHARLIHAMRVGAAILVSILLTTALGLPYGEWASITVLVVIGGLQHQGNIRRKAFERGLGTLIGAGVGLALILQRNIFGAWIATELMIATGCGICAYYAIGKAGYIALLSAITIMIVAGHGDNSMAAGLWRTVDIVIGIAIALAFSFALPLYATWSWRYKLADALRGCAALHAGLSGDVDISSDEELKALAAQSAALVELRSLMPWVSKETHIEMAKMEEIQRSLRLCLSLLDLMAGIRRRRGNEHRTKFDHASLAHVDCQIELMLLGMAHALKLGKGLGLQQSDTADPAELDAPGAPPLDGYALLTLQFRDEIRHLRQLLCATESRWNI